MSKVHIGRQGFLTKNALPNITRPGSGVGPSLSGLLNANQTTDNISNTNVVDSSTFNTPISCQSGMVSQVQISPFGQVKFSELDFEASVERVQQDIAKALGVPYVLLKSGNNANIHANQVLFYNHTIMPILEQFCSSFAHFFGPDMIIRPDRGAVSSLRADERVQALYYSTLVNTGIMTPNEAREGLRLGPIDGHSDIRIPQNITGSTVDASQGGRPSEGDQTSSPEDAQNG